MHMLTGAWVGLEMGSSARIFTLTVMQCMLDKAAEKKRMQSRHDHRLYQG